MTRLYEGNVESVTFEGRTYKVFDDVIEEADQEISRAVLGQSLTTDPAASSSMSAKLSLDWFRRSAVPFEFTCEVVIGIRDARWLPTGRPRPPRAETKRSNRQVQRARRKLKNLASLRVTNGPEWFESAARNVTRGPVWLHGLQRRVSVPRSLRPLLGRYVGGGR